MKPGEFRLLVKLFAMQELELIKDPNNAGCFAVYDCDELQCDELTHKEVYEHLADLV